MIRPRWQKVFADLYGNLTRTLLVVASIAVGLFALGVMATLFFVVQEDMERGYAAVNPANIYFRTGYFRQGLVDSIAELPGVRQAQGANSFSLRLEANPGEWIAIDMKAYADPGELELNRLELIEGVWPPGEREIVIDAYKLPNTNAQLGDLVTIELPSGGTRQLKLVGITQDQTIGAYRGAGGFFNSPVQGYLTLDTAEWLEQPFPTLYNTLYVTVQGDSRAPANLQQVSETVRRHLERNNIQIFNNAQRSSHDHPNLSLVSALVAVLLVIGLLVVFLSGFLITNTLQALINQQVQQIGILKSVGARRVQVVVLYLALNLLFGILAFAIAAPLAYQVAFRALVFLTQEINQKFYGFRLIPQVIGLQAAIAIIMPQIAALVPVLQGTRISVQEALSGILQDQPPGQGWLERSLSGLRNFSMILVVSLRNTFRRKGRLVLTLITLTLGGAVFIATFNVRVSLNAFIGQIVQYFLADVNITFDRSYRIEEISPLILEVPGVASVEGWAFGQAEILLADDQVGESVSLLAPPVDSPLVEPIMLSGRWVLPGDRNAIALSELFIERFPDIQIGDTIRFKVNGDETEWVVVGFYQLAGKISGFSAYTSYEYLSELINQPGKAVTYRVVADSPDLSLKQQEQLGQRIEAHLEQYGIETADVTTGLSLTQLAADGFNILTALLLFLAILTAMVGSIGLTGTMSLNVMERTREIGVLRAIGASDRMLMRMVLIEGALIGMISWLLASLLAFPISGVMAESINQALFGAQSNLGFTPIGFAIWLGVVVVLSILASVMPARNATRLTIREVLSYE